MPIRQAFAISALTLLVLTAASFSCFGQARRGLSGCPQSSAASRQGVRGRALFDRQLGALQARARRGDRAAAMQLRTLGARGQILLRPGVTQRPRTRFAPAFRPTPRFGGTRTVVMPQRPGLVVPTMPAPRPAAPPSARPVVVTPAPAPRPTPAVAPTPRPIVAVAPPRPAAPAPNAGGTIQAVLTLVNQERARLGRAPLQLSPELTTAALLHTRDMNAGGFLSHTGSNGSQVSQRVDAAGFRWSNVGENVAQGQRSPAEVMNSWMNSPGHRRNILSPGFTHIGISRVGNHWTQVFAAPQ